MEEPTQRGQADGGWTLGEHYEPYVGRWSRLVAGEFLRWLAQPSDRRWLDVGCGTGALTSAILEQAGPHAVTGVDPAEGFLAYARQRITDPRVEFRTGEAQNLPVESSAYDVAVSGLALNFVPHPEQAVAEMTRAVQPGGWVALYVWDYASRMQFMRHFWNAVVALDPANAGLDEGVHFPLCNPGPLGELFQRSGLTHVEVHPLDIWTEFRDFDDFWQPFLGGVGVGPRYVMTLNEADRVALRERLRIGLPFAVDGSLPLIARAWAVRGRR